MTWIIPVAVEAESQHDAETKINALFHQESGDVHGIALASPPFDLMVRFGDGVDVQKVADAIGKAVASALKTSIATSAHLRDPGLTP